MTAHRDMFVEGRWQRLDGSERIPVHEAATEGRIGTVGVAGLLDVDRAVRSAHTAFTCGPWSHSTPIERAAVLDRLATELERRAEATATLVSRQNGTPITLSRLANGAGPAETFRRYAELVADQDPEELRPSPSGATLVRREPVGVVAAITPWNFPQALAAMKLGPALALGCSVVLKPALETTLDAAVFAEAAAAAGLPDGVLNILPGGADTGSALVGHPLVDKVAFTGSTAAGRAIGAQCGQRIRACTLELGGKSASIVLDDVDLPAFVAGLAESSFRNNGQTCAIQARILAPRSRHDEVLQAVAEFADGLVVGDPLDPATTCGPMVSAVHRDRVRNHIERALERGARAVAGGVGRPAGRDRGWFIRPTVLTGVSPQDPIARDEVFGPVVVVLPYDDVDEAVALANDSDYGLGGSVWTRDEPRGLEVARRVRTGTIGVNYYRLDPGAPFGGIKDSGLGREMGPEGLDAYVEYKSIYVGEVA
ncbi:MAG: aldehyde dehydrogenase [Pseudonocardia sp. SCN 72-86]|nr:MAG: aldehyde dehydrogenase [Pseudonocardia sp. SCN 72-86]